jgi:hypothetical protein
MQRIFILSVLLIAFTITGICQTIQKDSIQGDYIEFGSGGGFSGASKNYVLTRSGDIYFIKNILADANTLVHLKKAKSCYTKKIFSYVKKKKITELTYNEPGNVFHYMTLSINNNKNRLVWGSSSTTPPENIITLSTKLHNLLQ